jgi:hypothetical protein
MKRLWVTLIGLGAGLALLGGTVAVQAARKAMTKEERTRLRQSLASKRALKVTRPGGRHGENVVGTIQYDPGAPADSFMSEPGGDRIIANRFNTAVGVPLRSGNLTAFEFFPGAVSGNAVISVVGPPVGTAATQIASIQGVPALPNQFNTFNVSPAVGVPNDFMAGLYVGSFGGTDEVGLRAASNAGQGFHAMQMEFNGAGPGQINTVVALPGQNVMFRSTGNILTPVELMNFQLE